MSEVEKSEAVSGEVSGTALLVGDRDQWMIKIMMIIRSVFRDLFGSVESDQSGHFVDHSMSAKIGEYSYWIDYPKGDHILEGKSDSPLTDFLFLNRHAAPVSAAVVSNDGRWLFTASYDRSIIKWNLLDNSLICNKKTHEAFLHCLAYGPSSLVSGSTNGTLKVWNPDSFALMHTLVGHSGCVNSVSVNERGTLIVSGSFDKTIRVWSVKTGECTRVLSGHRSGIRSVLSIDDLIISASEDQSIRVWNTEMGTEQRCIKDGINQAVTALSMNSNRSLVACNMGTTLVIYRWPSMEVMSTIKEPSSVLCCFHSVNPAVLALGVTDFSISIYHCTLNESICTFKGHLSEIECLSFTPDGSRLISGSYDKSVRVWTMPVCLNSIPME